MEAKVYRFVANSIKFTSMLDAEEPRVGYFFIILFLIMLIVVVLGILYELTHVHQF